MDIHIPIYMDGDLMQHVKTFVRSCNKGSGSQCILTYMQAIESQYCRRNFIIFAQSSLPFRRFESIFITPETICSKISKIDDLLQENVKYQSADIALAYRELSAEVQKRTTNTKITNYTLFRIYSFPN